MYSAPAAVLAGPHCTDLYGGVLVTIGERSGADGVGGCAAESESDGTGVFKCCDLCCWVLILVTEVMGPTMKCDAGPSSSDGSRGVVLARKKLI